MSALRVLTLLLLLLVPTMSWAIDTSFCDDDGITEVPSFASGRDATQCLLVDPGNGDAIVKFQFEDFHETTQGTDCSGSSVLLQYSGAAGNVAKSKIIYDTVMDNYLSANCKNKDVNRTGNADMKGAYEYLYFKNSKIINSVHCDEGTSVTGPGGIFNCTSNSGIHVDTFQLRGNPVNGGWAVFQGDGGTTCVFGNGHHIALFQASSPSGPVGSFLFQGCMLGNVQSMGAATTWIDDCIERGEPNHDLCNSGSFDVGGNSPQEVWYVDVWGNAKSPLQHNDGNPGKVIVVNTGCGVSGCNGTIGYGDTGYPHPVHNGSTTRSPTCPNGQIATTPPTYCYTSMENAIAGGHTMPPFAKLSCEGWATPPVECTEGPPPVGNDLSVDVTFTSPINVGSAPSLTATIAGNDGTTTITWDCDGDTFCDDGTADNTSPYTSQNCPVINTPGTYTMKACAVDSDDTATDTGSLVVTTVCGDNNTDTGETCDGTDVNGLDCTAPQFGDFTGGTLGCESDCSAYNFDLCTGGSGITCGDDVCVGPVENGSNCFADCAQSSYAFVSEGAEGWDYHIQPVFPGAILDRAVPVNQHSNLVAEPITEAISAYRFIFDSDEDSEFSLIQNSPLYSMCGDSGTTIDSALPCTPPLPRGTHTVAITPCNQNFSGVFDEQPFDDTRCTGGGGTLGPTETLTFTVIYKQTSQFFEDLNNRGVAYALLHWTRRR
jgi:hypothetical protein